VEQFRGCCFSVTGLGAPLFRRHYRRFDGWQAWRLPFFFCRS